MQDVTSETVEELDFKDRVIKMSLGFNYLVVATATQCCIYNASNWNTPFISDIKETVKLIVQCSKHFLMADSISGIKLYSYEGKMISNPKFQGLRPELLNKENVSLSPDTLAIVDRTDQKTIRFFDTNTGKALGEPLTHTL